MQPKKSNESWTKYPIVEECLDGKLPLVLPPHSTSPQDRQDRGVARQPSPSWSSQKITDPLRTAAIKPLTGSQMGE